MIRCRNSGARCCTSRGTSLGVTLGNDGWPYCRRVGQYPAGDRRRRVAHNTSGAGGRPPHTSIDTEAGWNTSGGHGWWYGWTRHLAVTVGSVWSPRAAELTVVNRGGNEVAPLWLAPLPAGVRYVLGDTYDNAPTLRQLVWLLLREYTRLNAEARATLARIRQDREVEIAYALAQCFRTLVQDRVPAALAPWLSAAAASRVPDLQTFAAGLQRDYPAVEAALRGT
jgi:Transposase